jgi:hypothetical protein
MRPVPCRRSKVENVVSGCFARFGDDMVHEVRMQAKMMLFHQLRQKGLDRGRVAEGLGAQQHSQSASKWYAQRARGLSAVSFIDQKKARCALYGQGDRLCFAAIELRFELRDEGTIGRAGDLQPARVSGICSHAKRSDAAAAKAGARVISCQTASGINTSP